MSPNDRLRMIRIKRGYDSAPAAAAAIGLSKSTYHQHENGIRPLSREAAARYARFFRVSLDWLLLGTGSSDASWQGIPVLGLVGAGASVEMVKEASDFDPPLELTLPSQKHLAALRVEGDSMWPRYLEGEFVLFDPRPLTPTGMTGHYVVADLVDGRRLLKTLRKGGRQGVWKLESHNAAPIEDIELLAVYRVLGALAS